MEGLAALAGVTPSPQPGAQVTPSRPPAVRRPVLRQYELVERVKGYDSDADEDLLNRAYVFAMRAHGSGFPAAGRS